ncbi:tyrosine-type recombinase/integrase [Afipia clevelandensis]|uniref:Tyr recombinase domain-containing protein n=1 Tax=Afipia clevelandensis ATCC 49720 TaxID=883079 RepID=K8PK69_9BRAD|nr:site-specific integrase [Afipia clevelandensis]EKS39920.1 hypothetical protein HMPREF9696_00932 [Afipia clevelandensis ATCC 49720]
MARLIEKLDAHALEELTEPGRYGDGDGLWLQVSKRGNKSWLFVYSFDGKRNRAMGLGSFRTVSLKKARAKAKACRDMVADKIDPLQAKRDARDARIARRSLERLEAAKPPEPTFGQCASMYIEAKKPGWTNAKHIAQWHSTFNETRRGRIVFPAVTADLNSLPVSKVDTEAVFDCLNKIWATKTETAKRARGRIEKVMDWAKIKTKYVTGDNPARWTGHLSVLLAQPSDVTEVENHPSMPFDQLPAFLERLRQRPGISARALEFLILTATRTGAVIYATWPEIDFDNRLWTIPYGRKGAKIRAKNNKQGKTVPLTAQAIALLKALPREDGNPYVFIGSEEGQNLSNMAMLELLREMLPSGDGVTSQYVTHGFRATFKDWALDQGKYPSYVSEFALWHSVKNKVEASYVRNSAPTPRALMMADWANYCARLPVERDTNVTSLQIEREVA